MNIRVIIFFLLGFLIKIESSFSQQSYPFPQPGYHQGEVEINNVIDAFYGQDQFDAQIEYVRDTVVDSVAYSYFFRPYVQKNPYFYTSYDSGKVYQHGVNADGSVAGGWLLYDFSITVGDTFVAHILDSTILAVDSVGIITLENGQQRKYLELSDGANMYRWIDGIGDIERGFNYLTDLEGGRYVFVCHSDSGGLLYQNPEAPYGCSSTGDSAFLITASAYDLCAPDTVYFEYTGNADSVFWYFSGGQVYSITEFQQKVYFDSSGEYEYYAVPYLGGLADTVSGHSTVHLYLDDSIYTTFDTIVCNLETLILKGYGGASNYDWNHGITDGQEWKALAPNQDTTYLLEVIGTFDNGCKDTLEKEILVLYFPVPELPEDTTICYGDTVFLDYSDYESNCICSGIFWSHNFAASWTTYVYQNGVIFPPLDEDSFPETIPIAMMISSGSGCVHNDTMWTTFEPFIDTNFYISVSYDTSVCEGEEVRFELVGSGEKSYDFSTTGESFIPDSSGVYFIYSDTACFSDTTYMDVTVHPLPIINVNLQDTSICNNQDSIMLFVEGFDSIRWSLGVENGKRFIPDSSQTYYVLVVDSFDCQNEDSVTIELAYVNGQIVLSQNPDTICVGDTVHISGFGGSNYTWNVSLDSTGGLIPNSSQWVFMDTDDGLDCYDRDSIFLTVHALPDIISLVQDTSICAGDGIKLKASGGVQYSWSNGSSNGDTIYFGSSQTLQVTGANSLGCENIDSMQVQVISLPNVYAGGYDTLCLGDSIQLLATGADSYLWNNVFSNGFVAYPTYDSLFSVVGVDSNGCVHIDTLFVVVLDSSLAPCSNLGIIGDQITSNLQIFPNPAQSYISIKIPEPLQGLGMQLIIFNSVGQIIDSQITNSPIVIVNISNYPEGLHYIVLQGERGELSIGKFIVE